MDSRLTIELSFDPGGAPMIAVMSRSNRTLRFARSGYLKAPYSPLGIAAAVHSLVRQWAGPELGSEAEEVFQATFEAVTDDPAMV